MSLLLSLFYFCYFSIVGVYIIFVPKVLSSVGYSASEIGVIFAAAPLVRIIIPFLFMRGLKLNKTILNWALLLMIVSSVSFYFSLYSFYKLFISNIFLGVGLSLILPYMEVVALENLGKERYGKVRLFGSIGFVLVSLVLGKIISESILTCLVTLKFLVVLTSITAIVAFVIERKLQLKDIPRSQQNSGAINLLADYKLWLGLIFMQVSFGAFYNFFTIYATDHGISLDMTIYLWSFGVFVEIIMLYFQGRFLKNNLLSIIQITLLASVIRWFLVFIYPDNLTILFISQSIHALSFALFHSAAISYLFSIYTNKPLAQQFFSGFTYGFGGLSGALISGYIYEWYPEYLFLSSAIFAFIAFVFVSLYKRERELRPKRSKASSL